MSPIATPVEDDHLYVNPKYKRKPVEIITNNGHLVPEQIGWLRSFPADTPNDVLRDELNTKGVVHIKNVMPRDFVLATRRRYFERVAPTGVLKEGTDPVEGIFCGGNPDNFQWPKIAEKAGVVNTQTVEDFAKEEDYSFIAAKMHYEDWTNEFSGNQYLVDMMRRLEPRWTNPAVLRRQIFRTNMPSAPSATSVHYDQMFFRHGPPTAITVWIPIGDCPPENGGLMYLENSRVLGEEIEDGYTRMSEEKGLSDEQKRYAYNENMTEKGGLGWDAGEWSREHGRGRKWLLGDYEAGDAVFHHMYAIHASGLNHDPTGRIRFSADLRFVDLDQPYDRRWCDVFHPGDQL